MRDDQSVDLVLVVKMILDILCKQDVRGKGKKRPKCWNSCSAGTKMK